MLFSVIMPTYNRAAYIRATLDSLRAQQFSDYETIIVDDGSTDGTLDLLRGYQWVKVLQEQNKGPGAARNFGVRQSTGKYLAFLDSDDIWFPWTLSTFAETIAGYSRPELVAAKLRLFWQDEELGQVKPEPLRAEVFDDYYLAGRNGYFVGACMIVVARTSFDATGGFTDKRIYAEDCDLALRLGLVRGFVQILAPVTLGYRQHASNAHRDWDPIFKGTMNLVESERGGLYPGGSA